MTGRAAALSRAAVVLLGAAAAVLVLRRPPPAATAAIEDGDFGPAPDFRLVERSGRPASLADLKGKVWVADFIFTRCMGPCPMLSARMGRLQAAFAGAPDFRLASFTVDPAHDTPAVLSEYAARFGADKARWLFLTGTPDDVRRLVRDGFKMALQDNPGAAAGEAVTHSLRLVLVDRAGRVRGYFSGDDDAALARLQKRLKALL